jgi:UDP-N-acetylmuramoyl-tripeptide--D-alanyl-D-alanine ligase
MEKVKLTDIASWTGGVFLNARKASGISATGVSIDTRTLKKGDIFFAVSGDRYNGHDFLDAALRAGACAAVVSDKCAIGKDFGIPAIIVKDTIKALQSFASHYFRRSGVKAIGITGSNGKTTTKEIVYSILAGVSGVVATSGNLNNHIGVPLTMLRVERGHEYCVLEMGANHMGEIRGLCRLASPVCGVITNAGRAHVGNFGSFSNIVKAKMELFESLGKAGTAVINADDAAISKASAGLRCAKITFGIRNSADITASDVKLYAGKTAFLLSVRGSSVEVEMPVTGYFNVYNALAAAACAKAVRPDMGIGEIAAGIESFAPPARRMDITQLENGAVIVNDAYNANPSSMTAAIENFSGIFCDKRKIIVIGDMLELGRYARAEHVKLGKFIKQGGFADEVLAVGVLARHTASACGGLWFEDRDGVVKYLKRHLKKGDAVLLKSSRNIGLDAVAAQLVSGR